MEKLVNELHDTVKSAIKEASSVKGDRIGWPTAVTLMVMSICATVSFCAWAYSPYHKEKEDQGKEN